MHILLYDRDDEPLTAIILKYSQEMNVIPIHSKRLLNEAVIFDTIKTATTDILWTFADGLTIRNDAETTLTCRLVGDYKQHFEDFVEEDRDFAEKEFEAYLMFALNSFSQVAERAKMNSLMAPIYSLPSQWKQVKQVWPEIHVPRYFLGAVPPDSFSPNQGIRSGLYDFYNWKEDGIEREQTTSTFLFEKPNGARYLVLVMGEEGHFYTLDVDKTAIDGPLSEEIKQKCVHLKNHFGYFICEILLFIQEEKITFGMITNYPAASQYLADFEQKVSSFLINYYLG